MIEFKVKGIINIEVDEINDKNKIEVQGDVKSIAYMVATLLRRLKEAEIPEELLRGAIEVGLGNNKSKEKVIVREIEVDKEHEDQFKEILKKMGVNIDGRKK